MKIKTLFVLYTLAKGGTEKVLLDILENMSKDKFEVTLLLLRTTERINEDALKGINIKYIFKGDHLLKNKSKIYKKIYSLYRKIGTSILLLFPSIFEFFRKKDYDVEIAFEHGLTTKLMSKNKNKKSKKIFWVHTDIKKNIEFNKSNGLNNLFVNQKTLEEAYNNADEIICVSKNAKKKLLDYMPNLKKDKVVVRYNPILKANIIKKAQEIDVNYDKSEINIVCCGRLSKEKGQGKLIKVHKKLIDENIKNRIILVGDGPEKNNLENLVKQYDLQETVHFVGYVDNPYPYIKRADILAMCSEYEGYCLAIAEGLVLNKPIISTKTEGAMELLDNGLYGILCDHSIEDIYLNMKKIVTNKDLREEYIQKSKNSSLDKMSIDEIEKSFY